MVDQEIWAHICYQMVKSTLAKLLMINLKAWVYSSRRIVFSRANFIEARLMENVGMKELA
jgi:hypothetical protein